MSRWIGLLVPGLSQISHRRVLEGATALLLWVGLVVLGVARFDRVVEAFSGGVHDRVALLTLVVGLVGVWWWSIRDANSHITGSGPFDAVADGDNQGAWDTFRKNRMALLGLGVICILYLGCS